MICDHDDDLPGGDKVLMNDRQQARLAALCEARNAVKHVRLAVVGADAAVWDAAMIAALRAIDERIAACRHDDATAAGDAMMKDSDAFSRLLRLRLFSSGGHVVYQATVLEQEFLFRLRQARLDGMMKACAATAAHDEDSARVVDALIRRETS